jgi:hypothetical protein
MQGASLDYFETRKTIDIYLTELGNNFVSPEHGPDVRAAYSLLVFEIWARAFLELIINRPLQTAFDTLIAILVLRWEYTSAMAI